jgi:hypothetical protein
LRNHKNYFLLFTIKFVGSHVISPTDSMVNLQKMARDVH